jgi:hypothetical protein
MTRIVVSPERPSADAACGETARRKRSPTLQMQEDRNGSAFAL